MNLRKMLLLPVLTLTALAAMGAASMIGPITLTLQNKCARPVKYEIKGGKAATGTVEANGKVKLSLEPGQKIFADGELCVEVAAADNGSTYIVCR